jgi:hypothetical protein
MVGAGPDVWEVISTVRGNDESVEEAAPCLQIPERLMQAAVAYYGEYREEIDADIELNEGRAPAWVRGGRCRRARPDLLKLPSMRVLRVIAELLRTTGRFSYFGGLTVGSDVTPPIRARLQS